MMGFRQTLDTSTNLIESLERDLEEARESQVRAENSLRMASGSHQHELMAATALLKNRIIELEATNAEFERLLGEKHTLIESLENRLLSRRTEGSGETEAALATHEKRSLEITLAEKAGELVRLQQEVARLEHEAAQSQAEMARVHQEVSHRGPSHPLDRGG